MNLPLYVLLLANVADILVCMPTNPILKHQDPVALYESIDSFVYNTPASIPSTDQTQNPQSTSYYFNSYT